MATTPTLSQEVDAALWAVEAEADFLPELAELWDREHPASKATWVSEWDVLMMRLAGLDEAHRAGAMTAAQRARYHALRAALRERRPLLARLGLPLPPAPPAE
ncbi:MAG TPA: hypothetical protein VFW96_14170 [Thermomicrobiales bacterium]|nr:hypothetical protein [Thermomicrobiales bacterium]